MARILPVVWDNRGTLKIFATAIFFMLMEASVAAPVSLAQSEPGAGQNGKPSSSAYQETTSDFNRRLSDINRKLASPPDISPNDYRIGPDDQLDISVLEAPELSRSPRVSASGEVSLALVGSVRAEGLTTRELELVIEELYRRNYILDPHVSVQVRDMQSHPVAVFGAVKKPGVYQIREPKTVVEVLSLAEGLDNDAGDTVIIERRGAASAHTPAQDAKSPASHNPSAGPSGHNPSTEWNSRSPQERQQQTTATSQPAVEQVDLKRLLDTGDPRLNVLVNPGDVVKVPRAELVYVVGEVGRPGGFELKSNENISVLQAIALAQGLTHTSAGGKARIIRVNSETGQRQEIRINLSKILAGRIPDPILQPRDIVYVPNSVGRTAAYRSLDMVATISSGIAVYRW
ncbi:MAG TPA: polysaccharide biosynthesis/export family protein [Candidatus Acidoferrales bacterium]|nr:polysaccharide biosynthesis/export family protein [Candidatus Acidoferrales bacterium]